MSQKGSIPTKDDAFDAYVGVVVPYITLPANATRLKVSTTNVTQVTAQFATWKASYAKTLDPATATTIATQDKNDAKANLTTTLKGTYGDIPESALNNTDRDTLKIRKRKTDKTKPTSPTSQALISKIDTGLRLQHTIHFEDADLPGKGKPDGVRACQIWYAIADKPPVDESELHFMAADTKSPYTYHFDGADAGKTVYYWVRWENSVGQTGPWGTVVSATITG